MVKELEPINHSETFVSKILEQYKNDLLLRSLLESFIEPMSDLEDQLTLFKNSLTIDVAEGVNLNKIGDSLNVSQRPSDDDIYRSLLFGFVSVYNSNGTPKDIVQALSNMIPGGIVEIIENYEYYPATVEVRVVGNDLTNDWNFIFRALILTVAAGIKVVLTFLNPSKGYFGFENDPGALTFDVLDGSGQSQNKGGYYSMIINTNENINTTQLI